MTYVLWPEQSGVDGALGGKARALADLQQAGIPIPPWFVLTPEAFHASLNFSQEQAIELGDVRAAATVMRGELRLAAEPFTVLEEALARLCPDGEPVAVRSSARDEDGAERSFAGQFDSFLFVPAEPEAVAERAAAVWRSAFSPRVLAYREQHGLAPMPHPPSVLIQRMVSADRSGVAFGADPVSGRRGLAVVAAVWGLGTSLVSGECDADTYNVERDGTISRRDIAVKRTAHLAAPESPEGVEAVAVPESESVRPVLSDLQIRAVADLARQVGRHSGQPRDIEWAIEEGKLYLLQSRPITALAGRPDPDGVLNLWDNSNIAESYNGVTTPLTFSFARRAYTEVYRQMCRTLGVSRQAIAANDEIFSHMLGLIRGRVYYNLLNWYRLLVLLPGFSSNRGFMEQMMGVREGLPDEITAAMAHAQSASLTDRIRMARTIAGMLANYLVLPRQIRRFHSELENALATPDPPLEDLRADELTTLYNRMEQRLLKHWDPPLVNDLFAMIFHGMLGKLTARWCGDTDGTVRNHLVRGGGGMISAEPALRVRELADATSSDSEMARLFRTGSVFEVTRALEQRPALRARYHAYIEKFGDRCLEELKLESSTLLDDPTPLHRAIGRIAGGGPDRRIPETKPDQGEPHPLVERVPLLARPLFQWVLRNARDRVRDRENLRFERTRLFGRVRRIFVEIGKRLAADGAIDTPRDIFYLEVEEILGYVTGASSSTDLRALTSLRKAEFEGYRQGEAPADRFETRGAVYMGNSFQASRPQPTGEPGIGSTDTLKGLGCCAGIVKARIRLIRDPHGAEITPGSILAAERTDPGWVMLFPAAAGLLVERGSLLSHSAIVAREMGIPAIVSIPHLTEIIRDGDLVEMDGSTGVVRRLKDPSDAGTHEILTNSDLNASTSGAEPGAPLEDLSDSGDHTPTSDSAANGEPSDAELEAETVAPIDGSPVLAETGELPESVPQNCSGNVPITGEESGGVTPGEGTPAKTAAGPVRPVKAVKHAE